MELLQFDLAAFGNAVLLERLSLPNQSASFSKNYLLKHLCVYNTQIKESIIMAQLFGFPRVKIESILKKFTILVCKVTLEREWECKLSIFWSTAQ